LLFFFLFILTATGAAEAAGFSSCTECHSSYCEAWQNTTHGSTLQPYTPEGAAALLTPQNGPITIGTLHYSFKSNDQNGWIEEKTDSSTSNYQITWLVGGKNIIAFLSTMGRGRLQLLPLAYNIRKKVWINNSAMLPHGKTSDSGDWKSSSGTFSTDCFSCHADTAVSFFTPQSDSYAALSKSPGISCSSCHGSADAHEQTARKAQAGGIFDDHQIFSFKTASPEQINDTCASCHSANIPLTAAYIPGKPFFDHFDLKGLENMAFLPDGRSLGDSHIFTQWRMSACAKSGKLQCLHCHTGGGAYRFNDPGQENNACLPCHKNRVGNAAAHTHHKSKSPGNICISCHMPMVELSGFEQTDHSLRPPLPSATRDFKSPNACTLCHDTKDITWADIKVSAWHADAYQTPYLKAGVLIKAARIADWTRLPAMLEYIENPKRDEITVVSLIRLLRVCNDARKWPVFINSLKNDPSPLVRSAAAGSLKGSPMGDTASALFAALNDKYALVRIRAVSMLAMLSSQELLPEYRPRFEKALNEFTTMLSDRPDDPGSYYNLGNLFLERRDFQKALAMYEQCLRLEPNNLQALLNCTMALYYSGQLPAAEQKLRSALKLQPNNPQAHVTLGMLLLEQKRPVEAEAAFRTAIKHDPSNAAAYFNLAVMKAAEKPKNSLEWCRKASELEPDNPKYAYTYAFYLNRAGKTPDAIALLKKMVDKQVPHPETYALLAQIHIKQNKKNEARAVYKKALANKAIPQETRMGFMEELQKLE